MRFPLALCMISGLSSIGSAWALSSVSPSANPKFVILGGTGKIGTAVAAHLLKRSPECQIVLVGRRSSSGEEAIEDIQESLNVNSATTTISKLQENQISFQQVDNIWDGPSLAPLFEDPTITGVIHTAGPYADETPTVLEAAIAAQIPVYVDVSDPLPFLEASLNKMTAAKASKTTALCAAGAFPGMSNVLAMEAAAADTEKNSDVQDVRFHYFTKGLGGSGTINLYITNIGFGDPMTQHDGGSRQELTQLSGKLLGQVDFFLDDNHSSSSSSSSSNEAQQRVGRQQVFAWPFPEAATVASELQIKGSSSAAMGTAPDLWNVMLGLLVDIVPRPWWRSRRFSKFMADFSQPLVLLTDAILQRTSPDLVGETHAMRIDVTTTAGTMTSIVQAHESFRQCVGQSCAEFALDLTEHPSPGVYLPEQRYRDKTARQRITGKLTTTPGTFCYTGPVKVSPATKFPTNIDQVVALAKKEQAKLELPA